MSASPNDVPDDVEKQSVDELAEGHTADDAEPGQSPSLLSVTLVLSCSVAPFLSLPPSPACLFAIVDRSPLSDRSIPLI